MDKQKVIEQFQTAHDAYFKLLLETYPTKHPITDHSKLGDPRSCALAVQVQSCLIALGPTAQQRMLRLGFDLLYPFNNIVDQYNWRASIIEQNTNFTTFASIAIRIDAELRLIKNVLTLSDYGNYEGIASDLFAQSKTRYTSTAETPEQEKNEVPPPDGDPRRIKQEVDNEAVENIPKLERSTNIASNIANVLSACKTLLGL